MGSVEPLKGLHARWGDHVQFVDVMIRQAHPGPQIPSYRNIDQKKADALQYKREHDLPWPVLVDDLQGTVHQTYSGLADPTYLIDASGHVSFVNAVTFAPALHAAIQQLVAKGGLGVVDSGWDRIPRIGPTLTDGWKGLRRGLPQSLIDIETSFPGSGVVPWLGYQIRPVLAPVTLRSEPLPGPLPIVLRVAWVALFAAGLWLLIRQIRSGS